MFFIFRHNLWPFSMPVNYKLNQTIDVLRMNNLTNMTNTTSRLVWSIKSRLTLNTVVQIDKVEKFSDYSFSKFMTITSWLAARPLYVVCGWARCSHPFRVSATLRCFWLACGLPDALTLWSVYIFEEVCLALDQSDSINCLKRWWYFPGVRLEKSIIQDHRPCPLDD